MRTAAAADGNRVRRTHDRSGRRNRARAGLRGESGQAVVLFALLIPVFFVLGAIVIDVGYWFVAAKRAQTAADAGALAAAYVLPDATRAVNDGTSYVATNLPADEPELISTAVVTPYAGDPTKVEVTVVLRPHTIFGGLVGIDSLDLTRRAVAEKKILNSRMAIFSASTDCDKGFLVNGTAVHIDGHVHSNGQYDINAAAAPDHFTATSGTIAKENCLANVSPPGPPSSAAGAQYGDGPDWLPEDGEEIMWPEWFTPAQFGWYLPEGAGPGRCTYKSDEIDVTATHLKVKGRPDVPLAADPLVPGGTLIPTGTYCATKHFKVTGDKHRGEITALSPLIQINGNGQDYRAHDQGVLFFTVPNVTGLTTDDGPFTPGSFTTSNIPPYPPCLPSPAVETELNGNKFQWAGVIFNPCGRVKINVQDTIAGVPGLVGTIYGFEVEINGDGFSMIGTGASAGDVVLSLVE